MREAGVKPEAAQAIIDHAKRNGAKPRYRFDAENHIHLLDDKPLMGTSTVVGALGKPLTYWAAGCALTPLGWLNRKKSKINDRLDAAGEAISMLRNMTREEYVDKLEQCYHAHSKVKDAAADDGTNTHKQLEHYVQSCIDDNGGEPCKLLKYGHGAVETFADWAVEHVRKFIWSEKHCYSERLWVGGISDCGARLTNNHMAIIDFKRRGCYFSQFVQIGGYACQIEELGLLYSDGKPAMSPITINDIIVFPNAGKPRTEPAAPFMQRFAEVVAIYRHQKEYDVQD
jgi:hypothetical protein